ncbi:MAG: tRNA (adenosine(37)-N6)-dimethylallyltransferase MiaA [Bacteroidota bacterium]
MNIKFPLLTVLGPTAVGKTAFAAHLALELNAEIISADSRQVYRGMDIGTGKDKADYIIDNQVIPSHLIDIADPGTEYNVFQFQRDFKSAYSSVISKGKIPILCGGTGLYLESVLSGYRLTEVPENIEFRIKLSQLTENELIAMLSTLRPPHNTTDILDRDRLIRAIEIESFKKNKINTLPERNFAGTPVFGINFERKNVRDRITSRLIQRLDSGMIEEVQCLLDRGISLERLKMYGLEYKYIAMYLAGELDKSQMFSLLNTAIHQFAKRQMTWFRRMENKGIRIFWLEGENGLSENLVRAKKHLHLR